MICKVITIVWTSADIIKILLTLIDIVRVHNLKTEKDYFFPVKRISLFLLRNWVS